MQENYEKYDRITRNYITSLYRRKYDLRLVISGNIYRDLLIPSRGSPNNRRVAFSKKTKSKSGSKKSSDPLAQVEAILKG